MSDWLRALVSTARSFAAPFLIDTAEIARYTETNTADGVGQDWQPIATGLSCEVWPIGSGSSERPGAAGGAAGGVVRSLSEWTVRLPALTDVTLRDRITVTGSDRPDGRVFEVNRVDERSYEAARDCICTLVE